MVNELNIEVKELAATIQSLSNKYENVSFLDMHSIFDQHLSKERSSDYIGTKVFRVMLDVLFYKNPTSIDRLSKKRGLHLTLDGIHLNSKGSSIVAEEYGIWINQQLFPNQHK